jgi:hypothetical protein
VDEEPVQTPRPLWQWIGLAIVPGIVSNILAALARITESATSGVESFGVAAIMILLAMPILIFPYLTWLAKPYLRARGRQKSGRGAFVMGFWFLNMFLWGASCTVVLSGFGGFH